MSDVAGGYTMRNRVINGCCRVKQRASVSLTTSNQFGEVDRMMGSYVNGSAGTFIQQVAGLASGMTFKRGVKFNDVTLSSGYITFRHRIEALNTLDLSGQSVTVSAKIYHDYGSDTSVTIGLRKPSASDNFSSTSTIGSDTSKTISSGATTTISATYTLGSTDADNGLEIVLYHTAKSVTTKNFVIGDIQLTLGTEVEQMERRPYQTELALCQRYSFVAAGGSGIAGAAGTSTGVVQRFNLPVSMRSAPTATVNTSGSWGITDDYFSGYTAASFGIGGYSATAVMASVSLTGFSSLNTGRYYGGNNSGTGAILFSSEL